VDVFILLKRFGVLGGSALQLGNCGGPYLLEPDCRIKASEWPPPGMARSEFHS